jgi:hypothetical protein
MSSCRQLWITKTHWRHNGFIDNGSITIAQAMPGYLRRRMPNRRNCRASVNSIIENCTSVVDIVSGSERAIGGITGSCYFSSVQNCTSSGIISGKVWCSSGGIAGDSYNAEFNFCISSCSITSGFGTLNGGIAGASYLGAFNNCLNSGDILASAESLIGGIAGECYNSMLVHIMHRTIISI